MKSWQEKEFSSLQVRSAWDAASRWPRIELKIWRSVLCTFDKNQYGVRSIWGTRAPSNCVSCTYSMRIVPLSKPVTYERSVPCWSSQDVSAPLKIRNKAGNSLSPQLSPVFLRQKKWNAISIIKCPLQQNWTTNRHQIKFVYLLSSLPHLAD